jgi:hypothetical protein
MVEEIGDNSIHGQTSWISCGIRIQEIQYVHTRIPSNSQIDAMSRLVVRYQLRSRGSRVTAEDAQILENKRNHLQELIDKFERQADAFLLNHKLTDDIPMVALGDYADYDHIDDVDESGDFEPTAKDPSRHHPIPRTSDGPGIEGCNPEDIPLPLPSSLGWEWCARHGVKSLAVKEAKLRYAQANDSIHKIRLALGFKSALFRTQVRESRTQKTKTRAWTAIHSVDTTVHEHSRNYSMARDAYLKAQDPCGGPPELPPLLLTDLHVKTAILGAAQVGQRNAQLPWIWSFGIAVRQDGTWMDECE